MRPLVLAGVMLMGLAASACDGYDEGVAAYARGDYATALREFRPLAEQGHADSQHFLGFMYRKGEGVPQDDDEALKWTRKAAEQGHAEAQNNLGAMYAEGEGVRQDNAEALRWYRKAAEQGYGRVPE